MTNYRVSEPTVKVALRAGAGAISAILERMTLPAKGASAIAASWARTVHGLHDHSLHVGWVREQLSIAGAAQSSDVLCVILARAEQREERYAILLLRISLALIADDMVALKRAIATLALVRGQTALARFLGADSVSPNQEAEAEREETELPDFGQGRPLSLGERKSIARKRDRNLLARVLRDPHPDVIRVLLDNPALVEEDIVRLCARKPIKQQVLVQVFRHPRWVVRYRIRLALALNPHTPQELVLQLLPHLTPHDIRDVGHAPHASEQVKRACFPEGETPLH